jgi:hypothetical protein
VASRGREHATRRRYSACDEARDADADRFAAHGIDLLDDPGWMSELAGWARAMRGRRNILERALGRRPTTLGPPAVPLVYDF